MALLLLDGQLGGGESLEPLVGDRVAALGRDPVGAGGEPRLGPLDRVEPAPQVLQPTGVELVLVEALRIDVAGLDPLVALLGAFAFDAGDLPLDLLPLAAEQFFGAFGLHGATVTLFGSRADRKAL